ncbi:MFS transporter [Advenella sp. S44]|uniref:MFS transporter n=1 Tax=Advenella sp. S44 TaxID=1982755 RepID=UPI000C2A606B|nr:MFS transporter [Advenella sp. S44]PJX23024.1 MFS transporter [Advenella sp. S44]
MTSQVVTSSVRAPNADGDPRDWKVIALIGLLHGGSHFYQLVLPSLYLSLNREFGYSFAELGFVATVFFVVSGVGQASSGFVVDHKGARPVLRFGLACMVVSAMLISIADAYWVFILAAFIGGAGNSVFHPVDFSIINQNVSQRRLGHAFSIHGLSGNLGWALAPIFITFFIVQTGSWRVAAGAAAVALLCLFLATFIGASLLATPAAEADKPAPEQVRAAEPGFIHKLRMLLKNPALWGAFLFFAFTSGSMSSVQNFTIPILGSLYGIGKEWASSALSLYMISAGVGLLIGGFLAGSTDRTERIVAGSLATSGVVFILLAMGVLPSGLAIAGLCMAGFLSGMAGPSRDMLVRRVTPKGALGSVYGLVYSGMDVGSALGPVMYGFMLDHQAVRGPWLAAGVALFGAVLAAFWVAYCARRQQDSRPLAQGSTA